MSGEKRTAATTWIEARLFALVVALCLPFFSGVFHSSDSQFIFAVTESLVKRGEVVASPLWWHPETPRTLAPDGELYARYGIGASLLAMPFYALALSWHSIGIVPTVNLTNVFVTALTAVVLYRLIVALGHSARVAQWVAVLWAVGSSALVYATFYFTEPQSACAFVWAFFAAVRQRAERAPSAHRFVWLGGIALALAVLIKPINLLFCVPFCLYFIHGMWRTRHPAQSITPLAVCLGAATLAVGWYNLVRFGNPLSQGYPPSETFDHPLLDGLWGLLLSSQKGIVWYNPLLLASFAAIPLWWRQRRAELSLLLGVSALHLGLYAIYFAWEGGLAWGPRYLVPLLPLWMLPLASWLETMKRRWLHIAFAALSACSIAVQIVGATVGFLRYHNVFNAPNQPDSLARQWPIWGHTQLFVQPRFWDPVWIRSLDGLVSVDWVIVALLLALIALSGWALFGAATRRVVIAVSLAILIVPGVMLVRTQDDPRFGVSDDYRVLLDYLHDVSKRDEVMFLDNHVRTAFFFNHNRAAPRWYALDRQAGLSEQTQFLLTRALTRHPVIWLVTDLSPQTAAQRPIEQWLNEHAYPVENKAFSPYARLIRYDTNINEGTRLLLNARLGDHIQLREITWSAPTPKRPYAYLTLYWQALALPQQNYTVFLQLLNAQQQVVWQVDRFPLDGFRPTLGWNRDELIRDRYGWALPAALPSGEYRLIGGMYFAPTGQRLPLTDAQGQAMGDHFTLARFDWPTQNR